MVDKEDSNIKTSAMTSLGRVLVIFSIVLTALLACSVALLWGPIHASCKLTWEFDTNCTKVNIALIDQIKKWTPPDNCKNGGEKCLYKLLSSSVAEVKATHTTPVKKYVDDLTFSFNQTDTQCIVKGYSTSETWYAVLDYGTNYCNLHNLLTGAGLDKAPGFKEMTSDSVCTQYSSADCEKY